MRDRAFMPVLAMSASGLHREPTSMSNWITAQKEVDATMNGQLESGAGSTPEPAAEMHSIHRCCFEMLQHVQTECGVMQTLGTLGYRRR
jgi:hypothetical protein